ncbi:glycine oxidase ThiO [soil metagenome]
MNKEVLIIGGGVIGLSIARELHKRGVKRINIIDAGECGREASWAAAGMLGPQAEADEAGAFFEFCRESRDLYPTLASELLDETGTDIELDPAGTLYLAFSDEDVRVLRMRFQWQKAAGLPVEHLDASEVRRAESFVSPDVREALFFPNDWQVDNRKLCSALRRYCEFNGIEINENTRVDRLITDLGRVTGVRARSVSYPADQIVVAAGAWTTQILFGERQLPLKVVPIRGQMVAFHTAKRLFERVIYSSGGYIVPRRDGRILAGSTTEEAGFDREPTDSAAASLSTMACGIAPGLVNLEIADRWAGLRPRSPDGFPVIGRIEGIDGLYLATGHYRNGILLAPATAQIVAADIVEGRLSDYAPVFGTDRFRLRAVRTGN